MIFCHWVSCPITPPSNFTGSLVYPKYPYGSDGGYNGKRSVSVAWRGTARKRLCWSLPLDTQRQIAGKVRLGGLGEEQPDQVIRAAAGQVIDVLVEDADSLPGSPFAGFDNGVGFNDNGDVAFVTNLASPAVRAVYRTVNGVPEELAREGQDSIAEIEFFAARMNNPGQVVFRAIDDSGRRAIWMNDG